jgi:hypothetical protein
MKGELELPCCYRSRPFYTKSQGQGVSSCLERSGAPPGISRQAPAKMGGYQAVWARLWKGQRSGAPPGISRQAPAKMGGYQALWARPWQGAKVRCASSILRQAPAGGGWGPGPLGMSLAFGNTHPPLKIGIKMEDLCSGLQFISSLPKHW